MTATSNTIETGKWVEIIGDGYTKGRQGEVIDVSEKRARVRWTHCCGHRMPIEGRIITRVAFPFLKVIAPLETASIPVSGRKPSPVYSGRMN